MLNVQNMHFASNLAVKCVFLCIALFCFCLFTQNLGTDCIQNMVEAPTHNVQHQNVAWKLHFKELHLDKCSVIYTLPLSRWKRFTKFYQSKGQRYCKRRIAESINVLHYDAFSLFLLFLERFLGGKFCETPVSLQVTDQM